MQVFTILFIISSINFTIYILELAGITNYEDETDIVNKINEYHLSSSIDRGGYTTDEINEWYTVHDYKIYKKKNDKVDVSFWAQNIYKISFYNSIVIFEKKEIQVPFDQIK